MLAVEYPLSRAPVDEDATGGEGAQKEGDGPVWEALQECKRLVPAAMEQVGIGRWQGWTRTPLPPVLTRQSGVASKAFYKMKEMMLSCALPAPKHSVHLCEAPGGFVQAVASSSPLSSWKWDACTLQEGLIPRVDVLPMANGNFFFADVLDYETTCARLDAGGADLVTADGAVSMDHDALEREHLPLLLAQIAVAFHCLHVGKGTLVIKFFEGRLDETRQVLALLTTRFQSMSIIKPTTSKPTNSERYAIAYSFQGPSSPLRLPVRVSREWERDCLEPVLGRLANQQLHALEAVLSRVPHKVKPPAVCA